MKLALHKRKEIASATITQTLGLILACSAVFALTAFGSSPAWWSSRGAIHAPVVTTNSGVVTTNYVTDDYAAVTQGQLKQFTQKAVQEMNTNLSGGAGTNLNTMVSNWVSDYATNGYNATNIKPSDYTALNVGQIKYVGNKVWARLVAAGYTNAVPSWLALNTNTDNAAANLGQLKTVFNFSVSALTAATPTFSPGAGTYTASQTVTLSSSTSSAIIYYTTDGSTPTTSSSSVASGGTITVAASETLKAMAAATGYTSSSVASASYIIQVAAATPTFSPVAGIYTSSQTVTLSSTTSGAAIYYTTDGSTPTTSSSSVASGGTITVAVSETVKAIATATGYNNSAVASAAYTIEVPAATPTFSPGAGTYTASQTVTLSSSTSSAIIYYTTDGSTPTTSSSSVASGGTITVAASETLKAMAAATGYTSSSVASASYIIQVAAATPTFSPVAGIYTSSQTVTLSSTTSGAAIYYTTDGSTPTTSSSSVASGGTITVAVSETVKAIATATGYNNSAFASAIYTIQTAAATPTFSPVAGTYASPQTVTLSSTTLGATIFYTTDGSTPTTDSLSVASGEAIAVGASETLKAIAVAIGFNNSTAASAAYTITSLNAPPSSGLAFWLKADAGVTDGGVTPNNGGNVDTWTDQMGSYTVTQSTSGNEPTYVANDINGKPALHFNGNQWLLNSNTITGLNADMTMITVAKTSESIPQAYSLWLGNSTSTGTDRGIGYNGSDEIFDTYNAGCAGAAEPAPNTFVCEIDSVNSALTNVLFYRNGVQTASSTTSGAQNLSSGVTVGAIREGLTNLGTWQGDIAEVLVYDHQLSSSELDQVNEYLLGKYGLSLDAAPDIAPAAGSYTSSQTVTISSPLTSRVIHYTLDGSTPTVHSPTYTGPFTISNSALVQASLFLNGQISSLVASAQYYINDTGETGLPVIPTSLTATSISGSETDLTWTLSGTVNYSAINVYRSTNGGAYVLVAVLDPTATSYADQDIVAGDSYTYEVGTVNTSGISDSSASSSITPPSSTALTITVTTPSGAVPLP